MRFFVDTGSKLFCTNIKMTREPDGRYTTPSNHILDFDDYDHDPDRSDEHVLHHDEVEKQKLTIDMKREECESRLHDQSPHEGEYLKCDDEVVKLRKIRSQ